MTTNGAASQPAPVVRRLDDASSGVLAGLVETFEELQMVLRCCERLVTELAAADGPDAVVVEAVWTLGLLSYARCFAAGQEEVSLTTEDLTSVQPEGEVLEWHKVLLELRDHYADDTTNPRERFSVGVTQGEDGAASGVAITSARQPLVDDLTVRQTGAIAYSLSALVNQRIETRQEQMFGELKDTPKAELDKLELLDVSQPAAGA